MENTLEWRDTVDWEKIYVTGNIPSARHVSGCGIINDELIIYGGFANHSIVCNDVYSFNFQTKEWKLININRKFHGHHSFTCVTRKNSLYIFGGVDYQGIANNDIHKITPHKHSISLVETNGPKPSPRWGHAAALYDDVMYVFGGFGKDLLNDLYAFDFKTKTWTKLEPLGHIPRPRQFHSAVAYNGAIYILGGHAFNHNVVDFFCYIIKDNYWVKLSDTLTICDTRAHSAVVLNEKMYIFGGKRGKKLVGLYEYDFETRQERELKFEGESPINRYFHCACIYSGDIYILLGIVIRNLNDIFCIRINGKSNNNNIASNNNFKNLLGSEMFSDICFCVDNQKVYAHKAILSNRSKYFEALFGNSMKESHQKELTIDLDYKTFWSILEYIYTGETEINNDNVIKLLKESDIYLLEELNRMCQIYISKRIQRFDISDLLNMSYLYNLSDLMNRICQHLKENRDVWEKIKKEMDKKLVKEVETLISNEKTQ